MIDKILTEKLNKYMIDITKWKNDY